MHGHAGHGDVLAIVFAALGQRDTERLAKRAKAGAKTQAKGRTGRDPDLEALERQLGDILGLKVHIVHGARGGTVTLGYSSLDEQQIEAVADYVAGAAGR